LAPTGSCTTSVYSVQMAMPLRLRRT
jgi:hypothetical protein